MRVVYNNLGQITGHRMCYFRSTDIEQHNYHRLLWSVTDEMLYYISKGHGIVIKEKSIKKHGKIERIFIPVLNDLINYLYFDKPPIYKHLKHHFAYAVDAVDKDNALSRRFVFWGNRTKREANIRCKTIKVNKEPNVVYEL